MRTILQKKGKKCLQRAKKDKMFETLGKNVKNLKIVWERADDRIAGIGPVYAHI